MVWVDITVVMAIALILTAVFAGGFRRTGPWEGWWVFFLVVVLGGWMAALWARPIGPPVYGVAWLPILCVGLVLALLMAAATPPREHRIDRGSPEDLDHPSTADQPRGDTAEVARAVTLSMFFWIMILGLLVAIVVGYAF